MPNPNKAHPNKWLHKELESTFLTPDERLAFAMYFEIARKDKGNPSHTIFIVVQKGDKAVARNVILHGNSIGHCAGHSHNIAEYDATEIDTLIDEVQNHGLLMGTMLANDNSPSFPFTIDTSKPIIAIKPPASQSHSDIANHLLSTGASVNNAAKQIIINTLGLNRLESPTIVANPSPTFTSAEVIADTAMNNLEKAAKEMDLIKKFGKRNMEKLAKQMKYSGEVLNTKSKKSNSTHVN